jgi:hypothetical protein
MWSLALTEQAAIEIGPWPGSLSGKHSVHEANALKAVVVTREPGECAGRRIALVVVQATGRVPGRRSRAMRIGNTEIRPLGGGLGCLVMILVSILLSIVLTVGLNLLIR